MNILLTFIATLSVMLAISAVTIIVSPERYIGVLLHFVISGLVLFAAGVAIGRSKFYANAYPVIAGSACYYCLFWVWVYRQTQTHTWHWLPQYVMLALAGTAIITIGVLMGDRISKRKGKVT